MTASCCCRRKARTGDETRQQQNRMRRVKGVAGWILPGALLVLMPKCPICLAAYVALCTGFTMSYSSAHMILRALTALCIATLVLCVVRRVVSCYQNKQTLNLQPTQPHQ